MSSTLTVNRQAQSAQTERITYEEFLEQYDGVRSEWVDGEVVFMSPVSNVHQRIGSFLLRLIFDFVEIHDLGQVFHSEFQMKMPGYGAGREPDILFVSHANLPRLRKNYYDGSGDMVVEIISPESIKRDRETKFLEYQNAGVKEYWLIDPLTQQAAFFQQDGHGRFESIPVEADGIYRSKVLPGLWIKTEWLWQSPAPLMSLIRKELGLS